MSTPRKVGELAIQLPRRQRRNLGSRTEAMAREYEEAAKHPARPRDYLDLTDRPAGVARGKGGGAAERIANPAGAKVRRSGSFEWKDAKPGDLLYEGDQLKTGSKAATLGGGRTVPKGGLMEARRPPRKGGGGR